jgi:riboflavin synthase alpha subunit
MSTVTWRTIASMSKGTFTAQVLPAALKITRVKRGEADDRRVTVGESLAQFACMCGHQLQWHAPTK